MLAEKIGKLIVAQEAAQGNIRCELIAFELSLTQFVELENVRYQRPKLRFENITSLSEQSVDAVAVVFKLSRCVVNAKAHLGRLPFNTEL